MPLFLEIAPRAREAIEDARAWLDSFHPGGAARFTEALTAALVFPH